MVYRMTASYEDAAIILADSGMIQSTAEKKHLLLSLWSGEWFENMQSQELAGSASVPYRRESFISKRIYLDFDADFQQFALADYRRMAIVGCGNGKASWGDSASRFRHICVESYVAASIVFGDGRRQRFCAPPANGFTCVYRDVDVEIASVHLNSLLFAAFHLHGFHIGI